MANEEKIEYVVCKDFSLGLNSLDDPIDLQPGETPACMNVDVTAKAAMMTRTGYEKVCQLPGIGGMRGGMAYYKVYNDNTAIDQSLDPTSAFSNTSSVPTTIIESPTTLETFTPTKNVLRIAVWIINKGSGDWTITLHDAANTVLGTNTIKNPKIIVNGWNYFTIKYNISSGPLHFHVTSTVNNGTIRSQLSNNLSTASFLDIYSNANDYLIFFYNQNAYYITRSNTTPTLIGSYGTDNDLVKGVTYENFAVFGNAYYLNHLKQWNGSTLSDVAGDPPPTRPKAVFQNRLFLADDEDNPSNTYYSGDSDISLWGSTVGLNDNVRIIGYGDGQIVTAMVPNNDFLQVFKTESIYGLNFSYDTNYNLTLPQLQPIVNSHSGAVTGGSVQPIYGYSYYLSNKGFETYGPSPERIVADVPLPLSFRITPTVQTINFTQEQNFVSTFFDAKYMCAVAVNNSTINNRVFVYNENVKRRFGNDNWQLYDGIPAAEFIRFRDDNKREELYFVSNLEPVLFKFNKSFSDNGLGYNRFWTSKTFQFGERTMYKYLDIEGYLPLNAKVYVDIYTDSEIMKSIEIDKDNFVTSAVSGGYIGYNYVGSNYIGSGIGSPGQLVPMFKFKKRIYLSDNVNVGYNMHFVIRNNAVDEGWVFSKYLLAYVQEPNEPTYERATN